MKTASLLIFLLVSITLEPPYKIHQLEIEAFDATNKFRVTNQSGRLQLDTFLCKLARAHSDSMANGSIDFGHGGYYERIRKVETNLGAYNVAENVYMTMGIAHATDVVDAWSRSTAGHRENMLDKRHKRTGLGRASGKKGTFYTQIFCD